ncbi:MAG: class I SAM-dependent methyltransferase [Bacteroidota bacterium]
MNKADLNVYRCPKSGSTLELIDAEIVGERIKSGTLRSTQNQEYLIRDFLPDFTWPKELADVDEETRAHYDRLASEYDKFANLPFETFGQTNSEVREKITSKLALTPDSKVLEVGGGDGRGAEFILKYLTGGGELYFQELSPSFLRSAQSRLREYAPRVRYSIANASYLAFPDHYFDAAHHFGGISTFAEKERCLKELCRVVKPGGKIVVGDEGIGPWLRDTTMAKIMINSNPLIGIDVPIRSIPVEARDVCVEWIMLGAFYIIDFKSGTGEPVANYHVRIPSDRGGSHWTRYYGTLEGVSDDVKKMAQLARKRDGISMVEWLEKVIRDATKNIR